MFAARIAVLLTTAIAAPGAALEGTAPLELAGDPAEQMVSDIKNYLLRAIRESPKNRKPTVERLRYILGVVDRRVPFRDLETFAPVLADTPSYRVQAVRWPVLEGVHAEGILMEPSQRSRGFVVAIPDADQEPEQFADAQQLAAMGFTVLSPALVNRKDTYSGNPDIRMTGQPHREWLYRMTYPLGRHILGLEVQKVLAAVDWFAGTSDGKPVGVWGYGEGGVVALYAAAMDARIRFTGVAGYVGPNDDLWKEPIYRNVFGLLRDFGSPELASMIAPRRLMVDARLAEFAIAAGGAAQGSTSTVEIALRDSNGRQRRAIREIEEFCARLVEGSDRARARSWAKDKQAMRSRMRHDLIGELPRDDAPLRPRSREIPAGRNWQGYEVALDAASGVPAYGVLLVPSDLRSGQKLPVVVMQHGLDGRPQDLFNQTGGRAFDVYQNIGQRLVDAGFVVYMPQNPYIHDFRPINRLANPLGLTLFSFILRQHERTVEWIQSLNFVDASRVGFYGLSYGGTTALRVPPLIDAYALSICSGNFNEWIRKLTTTTEPYSYMFTKEYEIFEFDIAHIASHAEMAMLMSPRPFMVERGHADGVGIDEWVAYEYAKVARFYDREGLADRTSIAYFEGPHRIDGTATIAFLQRFLRPEKR